MERGIVRNYDRRSGIGSLTDDSGKVLSFMSSDLKGPARSGMNAGDRVMFERVRGGVVSRAMNVIKG